MLVKNKINQYNVNEYRNLAVGKFLLKKSMPLSVLELISMKLRGEGIYYSKAFDETKSIFIHIPKAAGTSISKALYGARQGHHTAITYKRANEEKFNKYYKFTIVRDPWERLKSTYYYLINSPHKEDRDWAQANISKYKDFDDFVLNWLSKDSIYEWKHFLPQVFFTHYEGKKLVDDVYNLSNLDEAFKSIIGNLAHLNEDIKLTHENVSRNKKETLSTKLIDKIASVYLDDITEFNFEYE